MRTPPHWRRGKRETTNLMTPFYFLVDAQPGDNPSRDAARLRTIARGVFVEKVLGNVLDPGVWLDNFHDPARAHTANGAVGPIEDNVTTALLSPPATRRETPISTPYEVQKTI